MVGGYLGRAYPISERRACRIVRCARASYRYRGHHNPRTALRQRMREMAQARVRYGYRKIRVLLNREGWAVGQDRTPEEFARAYAENHLCEPIITAGNSP